MKFPYMPMWWGDYLADTSHLHALEHGVYLLLISAYWRTQRPLDNDMKALCRIARVRPDEVGIVQQVLEEFFILDDGAWRHKRIDIEMAVVSEKSAANKEKARNAATARWEKARELSAKRCSENATSMLQASVEHAKGMLTHANQSQNQNHIQNHPPKPSANFQSVEWGSDDDDFDESAASVLGDISFRHGITYDALAHAYRNGCTAKEIDAAVLQVKKSSKSPSNWGPYIVGVVNRERAKPPPVAPGAVPQLPKVKMTENELKRMREGREE